MYFPYLRGRRFDYLALREADPSIFSSGKVLPIIEPIKLEASSLKDIAKRGISTIFVANPLCGDLTPKDVAGAVATHLGSHPSLTIGFNVHDGTPARVLKALFSAYPDHRKALIFHADNEVPALQQVIDENEDDIDWVIFIDGMVSDEFIASFGFYQRALIADSFHKLVSCQGNRVG